MQVPEQNLVRYYKLEKLQNNTSIVRISSEQDQISTTTKNFPTLSKFPSNLQLLRRELVIYSILYLWAWYTECMITNNDVQEAPYGGSSRAIPWVFQVNKRKYFRFCDHTNSQLKSTTQSTSHASSQLKTTIQSSVHLTF